MVRSSTWHHGFYISTSPEYCNMICLLYEIWMLNNYLGKFGKHYLVVQSVYGSPCRSKETSVDYIWVPKECVFVPSQLRIYIVG